MVNVKFPKSSSVDVMLFSEGTFPYIKGGVSSWLNQLMKGLPHIKFGVCFIGATREIDGEPLKISYEFPKNLVHLEEHFLFENDEKTSPKSIEGSEDGFIAIEKLYEKMVSKKFSFPKELKDLDFYYNVVTYEDFLYSKRSWEFICDKYKKNCPDIPFIDYFWTIRNIHKPIWILANILKKLPKAKIYHSPSTGYAGFLASLASHAFNKPMILTEHGIYTRERKIDMLSADWIEYKKPGLLQEAEEYNYIKKMWIEFFDKVGVFCYHRSNMIISLFSGAKKIQISYGASANRCFVIPNGVDVDALKDTIKNRPEDKRPIITLIGRVVSIKDIKTFIRAIKIATQKNPDIEGWIVGPIDEDLDYFEECQEMALSLGLKEQKQEFENNISKLSFEELIHHKDKIKFFGFCNIKDVLPLTAVLTLTSISEGMPLVVLEGFAAGLPCVATDVGSCRDLIEGGLNEEDIALGKAGEVTTIANPTELANAYLKFVNFSNKEWENASKVALQRVEKFYRQEYFLNQYDDIYKEAFKYDWLSFYNIINHSFEPTKIPFRRKKSNIYSIKKFYKYDTKEI